MESRKLCSRREQHERSDALLPCAIRRALNGRRAVLIAGAGILATGTAVGVRAAPAPFPPLFDLSSLDGTNGFALNGALPDHYSGSRLRGLGDINGDGIADLIIGAPSAGDDHVVDNYVVFGRSAGFPAAFELGSLDPALGGDGSEGFILRGYVILDFSVSVNTAGDINGDGIVDLIIGAPFADEGDRTNAGETYVVFGRSTGFPAVFDIRNLDPAFGGDGSTGFILSGIDAGDQSGGSVSGAGDVNADGIDDLLIGAGGADRGGLRDDAGESYVVFGRTDAFPAVFELANLDPAEGGDGSAGFILRGLDKDEYAGSVGRAGDVNGDGVDDLVIGAPGAAPGGRDHAGESFVVFGRSTGFPAAFELHTLLPAFGGDASEGFVLAGIDPFDNSGGSVSAAGDVNGDGIDDLLISAQTADPNGQDLAGESYLVFGRSTGFPASFSLSSLLPPLGGDGSAGFVLPGIDERDQSGISLGGAGDVNDDGIGDLLIGANGGDKGNRFDVGESYVVFGRSSGFQATFPLRSLHPAAGGDGSSGFILTGIRRGDGAGTAVSGLGDVNGDGVDDVLIGAGAADPNGLTHAGQSYVVFGRAGGQL